MLILQPTLLIVLHVALRSDGIPNALFPFVRVTYETDVQSSATNIYSGMLHNDLELRTHKE